nr:hypothetical protein [Tanacetum cinerariifolium]
MLEKSLYDSWKSRMEHYMENMENGRMILNSVQNGPLIWPSVTETDGTNRTIKYEELSATEKIQADCNCKATNIVFKGLPQDVYAIPKRPRNDAWYKEKAMLAEASKAGQILDEEQLEFLTDPSILDGQATQTTILNNASFQTENLDAYNSDCDDVLNAKAVLMANLSSYGSDVLSE